MRLKNTLTAFFAICAIHAFSQDSDSQNFGRHEVKLNLFYAVLEGASLEYEYIINSDFTIGLGASYFLISAPLSLNS